MVEYIGDVKSLPDAEEVGRAHQWVGLDGPPVPVLVAEPVWELLVSEAVGEAGTVLSPRVFRLFMPRGKPRVVVHCDEITDVWLSDHGVVRWHEGGYPAWEERLRKGGNAFIRDELDLLMSDAWWMGREQTDLRIVLKPSGGGLAVGAWWGRGGTSGLSGQETDGELWPAAILVHQGE